MFDFRSKTYIRFSAGNDPISWAIQARTGCRWSHCDVLMPDGLLGSLPGGGVKVRSRIRGEVRSAIYEVPVQDGYFYAREQIGKPYDWCAVAGLGFWFPRDWQDEHKWFCAELVAASLMVAGCPLTSSNAWGITPRDLLLSPQLKAIEL